MGSDNWCFCCFSFVYWDEPIIASFIHLRLIQSIRNCSGIYLCLLHFEMSRFFSKKLGHSPRASHFSTGLSLCLHVSTDWEMTGVCFWRRPVIDGYLGDWEISGGIHKKNHWVINYASVSQSSSCLIMNSKEIWAIWIVCKSLFGGSLFRKEMVHFPRHSTKYERIFMVVIDLFYRAFKLYIGFHSKSRIRQRMMLNKSPDWSSSDCQLIEETAFHRMTSWLTFRFVRLFHRVKEVKAWNMQQTWVEIRNRSFCH
jgi:hypothetical protein